MRPDAVAADAALASMGQRLGARILDALVLVVPAIVILVASLDEDASGERAIPLWASLAILVLGAGYEILMVAARGQTVGKMAMKIKVVRADGTGQVPSLGSSAIRYLLPAVVAGIPVSLVQLLSLVIYLWAFRDPHRQGLHDKAAGTLVVQAAPVP